MSDIDTGLLSLPAPTDATPAPAATQPALPVSMPSDWTTQRAYAFMRELAQEMFPVEHILKTHSVTDAQYAEMQKHETFGKVLETMKAEWHKADNTPKRLALEAMVALEKHMPDVVSRMGKPSEDLDAIVRLAALLAKMGGIGEQAQAAGPSEKFKITINLGADTQAFEKQRQPIISIGTGSDTPVEQLGQGEGGPTTLRFLPPGPGA